MRLNTLIARIVGGISLTFGIALAMLVILAVERQLAVHGKFDKSLVVIVPFCSMISAFCALVGYRLLFNRPNRNGSLGAQEVSRPLISNAA
jgi:peptidoglycan/LPS O-acetylase OafA/YrhL